METSPTMGSDTFTLSPEAAGGIGLALFAVFAVIGLAALILTIIIWWKIFAKAGWSGALSLLQLIPIPLVISLAFTIVVLVFAFSKWPIQRELEALKQSRGG